MNQNLVIQASAPANIALIKYMGKADPVTNQPSNASLSWTLMNLRTTVALTPTEASQDLWEPMTGEGLMSFSMDEKGRSKYLNHFARLKKEMNITGQYLVRSANNFPSDCGLASSASSFAALTLAAHELACAQGHEPMDTLSLAHLSRLGSGSSVRSFFDPWVLWQQSTVRPLEFPVRNLSHMVVTVEMNKKKVSSSEAHSRIVTSSLNLDRAARAEKRLAQLMLAFRQSQWKEAFDICWAEFWDMHALFETSQPPFGYMNEDSQAVLKKMQDIWSSSGDGPLVTMDAGPNVHLLFRPDQAELREKLKADLGAQWTVM